MGWVEAGNHADRARDLAKQAKNGGGDEALADAVVAMSEAVQELIVEIRILLRGGKSEFGTTP